MNLGDSLTSNAGIYTLTFAPSGQLVLYNTVNRQQTNLTPGIMGGVTCSLTDTQLVINGAEPPWQTPAGLLQVDNLVVQDDGQVVIYSTTGAQIWAS